MATFSRNRNVGRLHYFLVENSSHPAGRVTNLCSLMWLILFTPPRWFPEILWHPCTHWSKPLPTAPSHRWPALACAAEFFFSKFLKDLQPPERQWLISACIVSLLYSSKLSTNCDKKQFTLLHPTGGPNLSISCDQFWHGMQLQISDHKWWLVLPHIMMLTKMSEAWHYWQPA